MDLTYLFISVLSVDHDEGQMVKALKKGAIHYIKEPVQMQDIQNLWQHIIRRSDPKKTMVWTEELKTELDTVISECGEGMMICILVSLVVFI